MRNAVISSHQLFSFHLALLAWTRNFGPPFSAFSVRLQFLHNLSEIFEQRQGQRKRREEEMVKYSNNKRSQLRRTTAEEERNKII